MSTTGTVLEQAVVVMASFLLFTSCSRPHEMLWWQMWETQEEYRRVTGIVHKEQAAQLLTSDSALILSDSAIAYIERIEASLFTATGLEDELTERMSELDTDGYFDHEIASGILVGNEPAQPVHGLNSAYELRLRMEDHKRALERLAGMAGHQLDIYLATDEEVMDPSGTWNNWEAMNFYHVPFATVVERLTRMKIGVRQMEYVVLLRNHGNASLDSTSVETGQRP